MKIKNYITQYEDGTVAITDDLSYKLTDIIKDNYLSAHGQFSKSKKQFEDGSDKTYFDITRVFRTALSNKTDIDTKDAQVAAENTAAMPMTNLLRGVFKNHLKTKGFNKKFNEVKEEIIKGHVLVKKTPNGPEIVDLRNVVRPPHIDNIQDSGLVETTYLTWDDMLQNKKEWEDSWSDIEKLHEQMVEENKNQYIVHEHWKADNFKEGGEEKWTKGCVKYLDMNDVQEDSEQDKDPYLELEKFASPEKQRIVSKKELKELRESGVLAKDEDEIRVYPYMETGLIKLAGRWLYAGVDEVSRPIQKAYNKNMNEKQLWDELNRKGITVHEKMPATTKEKSGKGLTQEALEALKFGGVVGIKQGESLQRLNFGSLVGDFLASADKFMEFGRQMLGLTAQGTGEDIPSTMPATIGMINQQNAKTLYDAVIEIQEIFWEEWFRVFELRDIIEEITMEEWVKIEGDARELEELAEPFIRNLINEKVTEAYKSGGLVAGGSKLPDEEYAMIEESVKLKLRENGGVMFAQIKKDIIKNLDFSIKFFISNESFAQIERLKELRGMLQIALTNPQSESSPAKIEEEMYNIMGLDYERFKKTPQEMQMMSQLVQQQVNLPSGNIPAKPAPSQ